VHVTRHGKRVVGSKLTVIDNLGATFDRVSSNNADVGITLQREIVNDHSSTQTGKHLTFPPSVASTFLNIVRLGFFEETKKNHYILDISRLYQVQPDDTNWEPILIKPMQTTGHSHWFPFSRDPDPTTLASTEGKPIPTGLVCTTQEIQQGDRHMSNNRILEEITVISDLNGDDGHFFIRAEELKRCFPNGRDSVFEPRSRKRLGIVIPKEHFGEGIKVAGERLGLIKVLGLVENKTNDTNTWGKI